MMTSIMRSSCEIAGQVHGSDGCLLDVQLIQRSVVQEQFAGVAVDERIDGEFWLVQQSLLAVYRCRPEVIVADDEPADLAELKRENQVAQDVRAQVASINVDEIERQPVPVCNERYELVKRRTLEQMDGDFRLGLHFGD